MSCGKFNRDLNIFLPKSKHPYMYNTLTITSISPTIVVQQLLIYKYTISLKNFIMRRAFWLKSQQCQISKHQT